MSRWTATILACSFAIAAFAQANIPRIDGDWWLAANPGLRAGFVDGYADCEAFYAHSPVAQSTSRALVETIGAFYAYNTDAVRRVVLVPKLLDQIERLGPVAAGTEETYNGDSWRQLPEEREGFVTGFATCQDLSMHSAPRQPIAALVRQLDTRYGVSDQDPGVINLQRAGDKIGAVLVRLEAAAKPR